MSLIAAAVVAVGAGVTAYMSADAKKKAANERIKALNGLEELNIPELQDLASDADRRRFRESIAAQQEIDPASAKLREKGLSGLLAALDDPDLAKSRDALSKLEREVDQNSPEYKALKAKLLSDAQSALEAGATLPPEFQRELVRTGLETTGASGLAPDKKGAAGQTLRKLLGSEGIKLQEMRRQQAIGNIGAAQNMEGQRTTILGNLAASFQQLARERFSRVAAAAGAGTSLTPKIGLGGEDVVNISAANTNLRNTRRLGIADAKGQKHLAQAEMISGMVGAGTTLLGGLGGGALGGAAGGAAGGASQGTGILGWGQSKGWWGPQPTAGATGGSRNLGAGWGPWV